MMRLMLTTAALLLAGARADDGFPTDPGDGDGGGGDDAEKKDTDGICAYMDFDAGVAVNTDGHCGNPPKCSTALTAKNEYECMNGADVGCCKWDDNELLGTCTKDAVQNQLYKAADVCCDEVTESCSDDGWPKTCNLGCGSVMVPLMNKCLSNFPSLGLTASVTPLQTSTKACPCATEIMACAQDKECDKALDILPDLTVPEYVEFFTGSSAADPENHLTPGSNSAKLALLKCYQAQHYPTKDPLDDGGGN